VWRWAQQYRASVSPGESPLPEMAALAEWLEAHIPATDTDASAARISHGDYRRASQDSEYFGVLGLRVWRLNPKPPAGAPPNAPNGKTPLLASLD
jgi:hypothetical protein